MNRRDFLQTTAAGAAITAMGPLSIGATPTVPKPSKTARTFTLDYAPHFGMFTNHAGDDPISQVDFMAETGFRSIEDNWIKNRSTDEQKKIAEALARHDMRMGVFVMNDGGFGPPILTSGNRDRRDEFVADARRAVEVAKRTNAKWMTVICGTVDPNLAMDVQTANVAEALKRASDVLEPHDLVMVCEPLNWRDHHGQFLRYTPQSIELMKAVDSSSCRILQDLYHQQVTEGDLIHHMDEAWDDIPYFQVGDNPGRKEPGTGEINYANVFKHMHERGYTGIVGMEHGKSMGGKEGEIKLIEAYRTVDPA